MKINTLRSNVLAHLPRKHGLVVIAAEEGAEQGFEGEEVDLFVVWGEGRFARVVGVLDGGPAVGVVLDAEGGQESYGGVGGFGEGVVRGEGGCVDGHCGGWEWWWVGAGGVCGSGGSGCGEGWRG